ncbi:tropomyosin-like [Aedes albopictus]|uniref:Uncharacterized protein n=1 Tax=Aedes albopictus TaxID=7160 RepID=A0ABM1ZDB3_AEDAL
MAAKEKKFVNKLKALEAKLSNEKILNETLSQEVTMLKMREEVHALLVAENKTAINSELESKESEVREMKVQLESNKKNMEEALINRDILRNEVNDLQDKLAATEEKVKHLDSTITLTVTTCNKQKNELKSKFVEFEQKTLDLEKENHNMKTVIISLEQEKSDISSKFVGFERKILDLEMKNLRMKTVIINLEQENNDQTSKFMDFERNIVDLEKENHRKKTVIIELEQQKSDLSKNLAESTDKYEKLLNEKDTLSTKVQELETTTPKGKVETLRNEKKDLEKTLEREIREKTELKAQVTNILQEIGRLEEQLKDVKNPHSAILNKKQTLKKKIERLQRQHSEAKNKADKENTHKWQTKIKESETKLQQVECENSQEKEKHCVLDNNNCLTKEEATTTSLAKRKYFEPLGNLLNEIDSLRECVFSENYECLTELLWDDHG